MSSRTLQRRLQHGTSWGAIVDAARGEWVEELTARGASEKGITYLLGFSDPSALLRARKRWSRKASE